MDKPIPFHPVTVLFPPMMDIVGIKGFRLSLAQIGQLVPIWVYDGQIIDGRMRYECLRGLGIEPKIEEWDGDGDGDLIDFVLSLNLHRRHLTPLQQVEVLAKADDVPEGNQDRSVMDYLLGMNLHRRHLTPDQKVTVMAKADVMRKAGIGHG